MISWLTPDWPAPKFVRALSTLKSNHGNFSLNDNPRRDRHCQSLRHIAGVPYEPHWLKQVHGNRVIPLDFRQPQFAEADAAITSNPRTVCAVLTADCLPILLCHKDGNKIAAIHAGWRGLVAGVIDETCRSLGESLEDYLVWMGPAIGPKAFEVGDDVRQAFSSAGWKDEAIESSFKVHHSGKWLADIYQLARQKFESLGVLNTNLFGAKWCTLTDHKRFYSYRRSKDTERMATLIWLQKYDT